MFLDLAGNANIWIGNIMTIGIVLVLLLVFRVTDNANRNFRNIKKQTSRAIKEIDQSIGVMERKINDQLLRIKAEEETLQGIYEKFHGWSEEVKACRNAINSVADATRNADANLDILEKKGLIVEQLRTELEKVREERVLILDELKESNKSAVDALGISVLNNVQLKLNSIKGELDNAEKHHEALKNETGEMADRTRNEIKQFADEYLGRLNLLGEQSRNAEEEMLAGIRSESTARIEKAKESIEQNIAGYQNVVAEKLASVEKLLAESNELESVIGTVKGEVESLRQSASEELAGRISVFSDEFVSEIRGSYEKFSGEYRDKLGTLSEKIENEKESMEESTRTLDTLRELTPAITKQLDEINRRMEWIAGTETRMLGQIKKAEELISLLGGLTGSNSPSHSAETTASDNSRNIKQLIEMGWDDEKISEKLGVSESEISFVRSFLA